MRVKTIRFSTVLAVSALNICLLASLGTQQLYGQAATASITGTVTDSSGALFPAQQSTQKTPAPASRAQRSAMLRAGITFLTWQSAGTRSRPQRRVSRR